jgi:hypothetical protein
MREIRQGDSDIAHLALEEGCFLMRQFQEIFQKAEIMQRFKRRGMNCIAAKIAQKVSMLFDDDRIDTRAGKGANLEPCRPVRRQQYSSGKTLFLGSRPPLASL